MNRSNQSLLTPLRKLELLQRAHKLAHSVHGKEVVALSGAYSGISQRAPILFDQAIDVLLPGLCRHVVDHEARKYLSVVEEGEELAGVVQNKLLVQQVSPFQGTAKSTRGFVGMWFFTLGRFITPTFHALPVTLS